MTSHRSATPSKMNMMTSKKHESRIQISFGFSNPELAPVAKLFTSLIT